MVRKHIDYFFGGYRQSRIATFFHCITSRVREEGCNQNTASLNTARISAACRFKFVLSLGNGFGAIEHGRRVPRSLRELEDRAARDRASFAQERHWIFREMKVARVSFARYIPKMTPLPSCFPAPELGVKPSDIALRIFPSCEAARTRQGAEQRKEIRSGADIDHVELGTEWPRGFYGRDSEADDPIVVLMRRPVVMLEIGFRIEHGPAIVRVAGRGARWLFSR